MYEWKLCPPRICWPQKVLMSAKPLYSSPHRITNTWATTQQATYCF
jgi:hypothetical protein